MNTTKVVKDIRQRLEARGVHVHIHKAKTTSSVYLTFDGGLLKKARIGDHKGKGYAYTYELGDHYRYVHEATRMFQGKEYTRHFYPTAHVEDLVTQVLILRSNLRAKYGKENYEQYREAAIKKGAEEVFTRASRPKAPAVPVKGVEPWFHYKTPLEYRQAIEASPEYAAERAQEAEESRRIDAVLEREIGPDYDPDGFSTY